MLISRKPLCIIYAAIALVALVATWSQNIAHLAAGGSFLGFFEAVMVSAPSRGITVDFFLTTAISSVSGLHYLNSVIPLGDLLLPLAICGLLAIAIRDGVRQETCAPSQLHRFSPSQYDHL